MRQWLIVILLLAAALGMSPEAHGAPASTPEPPCPGPWGKFEIGLPFYEDETKGTCIDAFTGRGVAEAQGAVGNVVQILIVTVGALTVMAALVSIVVGGYIYMTAGGSADRVRLAKVWIASALGGMMLALLAWLIIASVNPAATFF